MLTLRIARGKCLPLGASALPDGVNFALLCGNGTAVGLVIYPVDGEQPIAEIGLRPWRPFRLWCSSQKADKNGFHRGAFGLVQQDELFSFRTCPVRLPTRRGPCAADLASRLVGTALYSSGVSQWGKADCIPTDETHGFWCDSEWSLPRMETARVKAE